MTKERLTEPRPGGGYLVKIVGPRRTQLLAPEYWHLLRRDTNGHGRPTLETLGWCAEVRPCDDCMWLDTEDLRLEPAFRKLAGAIDEARARWAASGRESRAAELERKRRERDATAPADDGWKAPLGGEGGSISHLLREGEEPAEGWSIAHVHWRHAPFPWEDDSVGVWLYVTLRRDPG